MAKDVNIHIKATGGPEAKQQLEGVAQGTQKVGSGVQEMGTKALIGSGWVQKALSFLAGPLGFAAIATATASGIIKIAKFFDEIKTRSDEAVLKVQSIRDAYKELFEAMDTFSEKSRQVLTLETTALLQRTAVTQQVGLPVVTAYAREFQPLLKTGEMTKQQFEQGLEDTLRYAGRQGAGAVPEMLGIMAGGGMVTPEQQGAFRRMVTEASQAAGLTEEELVGALGRGMPTIKAMGWSPEQALTAVATLAQGETGRKRAALPATTLQALMGVTVPKELQKQIPAEVAKDPSKLLDLLSTLRRKMPREQYVDILTALFGAEAAPGILKLTAAPPRGLLEAITEAAGPIGAAREAAQEKERLKTLEATTAKVEASAHQREMATVQAEMTAQKQLRDLGAKERDRYRVERPWRQKWLKEKLAVLGTGTGTEEAIKEQAAFDRWKETLTPEEREQITKEAYGPLAKLELLNIRWQAMTTQEKVESLLEHTENPPIPTVISNDSHDIHFNPVVGDPNSVKGPRFIKGMK